VAEEASAVLTPCAAAPFVVNMFKSIAPDAWYAPHLVRDEATGCLIWQRALTSGYAVGRPPGGKPIKVARAVYIDCFGEAPAGNLVRQTCRNRACCEPSHLLAGTDVHLRRADACHLGHPYTDENTYIDPTGRRRCRECNRINSRDGHYARREAANPNRKRRGRLYPPDTAADV